MKNNSSIWFSCNVNCTLVKLRSIINDKFKAVFKNDRCIYGVFNWRIICISAKKSLERNIINQNVSILEKLHVEHGDDSIQSVDRRRMG